MGSVLKPLEKEVLDEIHTFTLAWQYSFTSPSEILDFFYHELQTLDTHIANCMHDPDATLVGLSEAIDRHRFYETAAFLYLQRTIGIPPIILILSNPDSYNTPEGNQVDLYLAKFFGIKAPEKPEED